jgi:hypothetical protein
MMVPDEGQSKDDQAELYEEAGCRDDSHLNEVGAVEELENTLEAWVTLAKVPSKISSAFCFSV